MTRLAPAAAAAGVLLVLLAGCGGGKQASPADRWRADVDAACDRAENAVRDGGQARDVGDLDRVMVRVGDIVLTTADEIEALKVPKESKATAAPFLEKLGDVRKSVASVRKAVEGGEEFDIGVAAEDVRATGNAWFKAAERAGLKRCGRRAVTDAAVDELMIPGFTAASVEKAIRLHEQVSKLRRLLAVTAGVQQRVAYWKQTPGVMAYVDKVDANQTPQRLDRFSQSFGFRTRDLTATAENAVYWYRRGNAAKARAKEAKFFEIERKMQRAALKMLDAAGASGRELIPVLRRAYRRGGGGGGKGSSA